jgi:PAS domain S-box-containing protein
MMAAKERIAIIDDDTNLRKTLSDILNPYGYQPHGYANGQAAMEDILHGWFAVVLLDLRLEDFSGLEVLRFIKQHSPGTACIFLTGYASQDSAIEAVNAGAYSYFIKPVNIEQLLVTIRRAIEKRQTDLALVESERHYQALADVAPVGIFRTDAQGSTTYVNPRWTRISGFSSEQALGVGWFDALHPEDRPRVEQGWQETIAKRQVSATEYRFLHQDGSIAWVIGQAQPEFDASGNFTGYIGTITDITARKQTEAAIKRHLSDLEALYDNGLKLARLFEKHEIAQCIIDLLENRLHWHHAILRLYNAKDDVMEVIGYSQAGADPTQRERFTAISIKRNMGMTGWAWKNATVLRSGNLSEDPRYLETYTGMNSGIYVPLMAGDHVLGVISVESEQPDAFTEADERLLVTLAAQVATAFDNARLYSEILQRLEELDTLVQVSAALRTATRHAEMLPVILEQTMLVLHASGASFAFRDPTTQETVFELGSGDLTNHTQQRLPPGVGITNWVLDHGETYFCNDPGNDTLYRPPIPAARSPRFMVFAPLISQGDIIGVLLVSSQNVIESNQVNLLGTIANIAANAMHRAALHEKTLNYAAELEQRVEERTAELRAANIALERASRAKDEFLASMSHELRTPLTGILNLSEVLQEQLYGPLNDKQLHYTHIIEESGRHLLGLINDILDLSKIEAGQMSVELDLVQLDSICQACLQLTRGLANKKGQTVNFSIDPRGIVLQADARRIKQMLVNLLSNAVKFTPQGGEIGLEVTGDEQAAMVYITVWDTGIGIAQEDFMRLFLPFSQLDGSLARQHEGTGLGLAIAQRLANMHGGDITLESAPGQGSRFTIHLPWRKQPPEAQETRSEELAGGASGSAGARAASVTPAHTLLIADDNQTTAEIYSDFLIQNGFQIIQARTGQDALDLTRQQRPHLILMDIQMPGMDGLTAIQRLRAMPDPALARTPIIALTALAMPGDRERCLEAGADDYLDKPVSLKNLLEVVKSYLKLP